MKTSEYRQKVAVPCVTYENAETARVAKAVEYQSKCIANWSKSVNK